MLGALLRLWDLGGQSLWLDEAFTARVAPLDPAGIIAAIRSDLDTPPLHPFVVHAFLVLGNSGPGNNDFVLRLPSALAAILCIPLTYVVTRRLLGLRTALLATALMALSPYAIYYAQEARMYALVLLFTLLAMYCLLRMLPTPLAPKVFGGGSDAARPQLQGKNSRAHSILPPELGGRWWCGFVLASALGLYTHFFGFFVLGLLVLYALLQLALLWRSGETKAAAGGLRRVVLAVAAILLLYLPWLPVLLSFIGENYAATPYGQGWQANLSLRTMLDMLTLMLGGYWAHPVVRWATRGLFVLGLLFMARRRPPVAFITTLWIVVPFASIALLNPGHFVTERYFMFMLPVLVMGMAEGLRGLARLGSALLAAWSRRAAAPAPLGRLAVTLPLLIAGCAVPLLSAPSIERYFEEPPKPAWRQLAHYIAGTVPPGDLIIVATFPHWDKEPLQHYLGMGGRRIVYAAEDTHLRTLLAGEGGPPWWIVYAGSERRLGRLMSASVGKDIDVVAFDFLAVLHRRGGGSDAVSDGLAVLRTLHPRIPGPYQGEVNRVIKGLASPGADMGQPIAPPVPTTVK